MENWINYCSDWMNKSVRSWWTNNETKYLFLDFFFGRGGCLKFKIKKIKKLWLKKIKLLFWFEYQQVWRCFCGGAEKSTISEQHPIKEARLFQIREQLFHLSTASNLNVFFFIPYVAVNISHKNPDKRERSFSEAATSHGAADRTIGKLAHQEVVNL